MDVASHLNAKYLMWMFTTSGTMMRLGAIVFVGQIDIEIVENASTLYMYMVSYACEEVRTYFSIYCQPKVKLAQVI